VLLSVDIEQAGYDAGSPVLHDIHFSLRPGELVGLIGPNGAGKSSTVKSILGIMKHVKGQCRIGSYAYIPERPVVYERLTLQEHIRFLQSTLDVDERAFAKRASRLLERFRLSGALHRYPESFSKGMQQKVMIILALLKQADCYLIDEPFMGLDPRAMKALLEWLQREKARGAGILMSTHVLDTAERICDRFVLIAGGRLIFQGTLDEIRRQSGLSGGSLLDCFDLLTAGEADVRD
jgi:ABC-2 type transport system ATP-binding protein